MTLKRAYRQEHVPCQLGRSCALKPYILSEQALHFTGTTPSLQNISIAARSPRNRISGVFRGISFACFWPNLANWHAHRVNFIQLWRSRSCVTPAICRVAGVTLGGSQWSVLECSASGVFKFSGARRESCSSRLSWYSDRQPGCSLTLAEIASCQYHEKNI